MSDKLQSKLNFEFDSDEEKYFYHWLLELHELGYIDWIWDEKKTYLITNEVCSARVTQLKTKQRIEEFILTKKRNYTPDFIFKFNKSAYKKLYHDSKGGYENRPFFYCNNNRGIIYVDVKGAFGKKLTSSITFPDRQSLMCQRFNIYVQKVIPYATKPSKDTLFKSTFTPNVMITDQVYKKTVVDRKTGKVKWKKGDSKLKYKVMTVKDYLC
jgi:hypothetical protein